MLNPSFPRERLPSRVGQGCASSGLIPALWDSRSKSDQNVRKRRPRRFEKSDQKVRFATKAFQKRRPKTFQTCYQKVRFATKAFRISDPKANFRNQNVQFLTPNRSRKYFKKFIFCNQKSEVNGFVIVNVLLNTNRCVYFDGNNQHNNIIFHEHFFFHSPTININIKAICSPNRTQKFSNQRFYASKFTPV